MQPLIGRDVKRRLKRVEIEARVIPLPTMTGTTTNSATTINTNVPSAAPQLSP